MPKYGVMGYTLVVKTERREQFVEITERIREIVAKSGMQSGLCHVFVPHTTAGVTIQENADPDVVRDMLVTLARLVPQTGDYRHVEGNSDAHVKAAAMGPSQLVPVDGGRLVLGTWQGIYFCEFDGPRTRRVVVTLIPAI